MDNNQNGFVYHDFCAFFSVYSGKLFVCEHCLKRIFIIFWFIYSSQFGDNLSYHSTKILNFKLSVSTIIGLFLAYDKFVFGNIEIQILSENEIRNVIKHRMLLGKALTFMTNKHSNWLSTKFEAQHLHKVLNLSIVFLCLFLIYIVFSSFFKLCLFSLQFLILYRNINILIHFNQQKSQCDQNVSISKNNSQGDSENMSMQKMTNDTSYECVTIIFPKIFEYSPL